MAYTCDVNPLFFSLIVDAEVAVVSASCVVIVAPLEGTVTGGASRADGTARRSREEAVVARRSISAGLISVGAW